MEQEQISLDHLNENVEQTINEEYLEDIEGIVKDTKTNNLFTKLLSGYFFKNFSLYKFKTLFNTIEELYLKLKGIKEKIEIEKFATNTLDIEELKKEFLKQRKKTIEQVFPNINLDKIKEFYDNPITKLKSLANPHMIYYDEVVSRKYIIAIMQMIFNNMDLVIAYCGIEGTGKTTNSTQDSQLLYHMLKEVGAIDYEYSLRRIMYYSLKSVIQAFNKYSKIPFSIFILDEGNELNRKNWSHPLVQLFINKLRRERKHLRIVIINLPQLGELTTELTLSRINFIFQLKMKANIKTKLVDKGDCSFFIIPRTEKIYSYVNKSELTNGYVRDSLGRILDDKKKYYKSLPQSLCIRRFQRNGVWSFNEKEYDRLSKEANEQFSTSSVTLSRSEIIALGKYLNLKKMGVKPLSKDYHTLAHLRNKKLGVALKSDEYQESTIEEV